MRCHKNGRAFTVVEMMISMVIMGLVLALAVVEFAMVFNHNNLTNANMTAEQNARIAMAKVTNEMRQAMPNITDFSGPYPVVIQPGTPPPSSAPVPVTTVEFWRVDNGPAGLTTPGAGIPTDTNGNPKPCYDDVTLSYDPLAHTITRTVTLKTNANCPTASSTTAVIARNIMGFGVYMVNSQMFDVDLQTRATSGNYGVYDLNTQVALGYKP